MTATGIPSSGYWLWDIRADLVRGDAALAEYFDRVATTGEPLASYINAIVVGDRNRVVREIQGAVENHTELQQIYSVRTRSLGVRRIYATGHCIYDQRDEPIAFPGRFVDIGLEASDHSMVELAMHFVRQARTVIADFNEEPVSYIAEALLMELEHIRARKPN